MPELNQTLLEEISKIKSASLFRDLKDSFIEGAYITRNGRKHVNFSSNDYLGLAQDERVKQAAIKATEKFGAGAGAARLVSGNHELYEALEDAIAKSKKTEAALVFGSGYLANIGTISALLDRSDLVVIDKLSHSCIIEGAWLSVAGFKRFKHNDMENLREILELHRKNHRRCLIVTETIFSMDGDKSPLAEILEIAKKYDAWVMVDDAHGLWDSAISSDENLIKMGTLSKSIGSYGGYVAGSKILIDYLRNNASSFIFSTGLPPAVIGASIAAINIANDEPWRAKKALENARYFAQNFKLDPGLNPVIQAELTSGSPDLIQGPANKNTTQIIPVILGENDAALAASKKLEEAGFIVPAIRPPTVPKGTARLRFSFTALHEIEMIESMIGCFDD
jgi:8-amino-7-oxononanoate synthase